ncbi:MAG: diacylglycerol kinase family protein [Spirochaetes bacterium]|nr:diacylglycerol kinase family protein [Spirochaetota bacterium]
MKKIGVIVNLNSRKYKLSNKHPEGIFENIGGDSIVVKYTKSIDELYDVAVDFKKMGIDYVAPSGGDGTLHHVVTQFAKIYGANLPPFIILKGGTMNNVANSINLKGDAESILQRAVVAINNEKDIKIVQRKTMKIEDNHCFLFGNGLVSDFLDTYYSIGKSYTKLIGLICSSIYEAFTNQNSNLFKGFDGNITCDSEVLPYTNVLGVLGGTIETIGMGFYPLYRANESKDAFHIIVCAMKPRDLAKNVIKLKNGTPIKHKDYIEKIVKTIDIQSKKPFMYTMDGDLYNSEGALKVSTGIPIQFVVV